jgi:putative hydrolase of the HAD superfamily
MNAATTGVLFDLDNTLAHRGLSIEAYARRLAIDFGPRLVDAPAGAIAALIDARDNGGYGVPGSPFPNVRDDVADALLTRLGWHDLPSVDELTAHWFAHFPTCSVEMPGATALITRLVDAGIPVGIVSNGMESSRRALARHLGFDRLVRMLVSSERAGVRKPDAGIFQLAAAELGVPAGRCWFVGDHPVNDVAGSHAAGMRAVWLAGFHAAPDEGVTAPTITTLDELEALMREPSSTNT